ncbi:chymotrypsinogen A-like [Sitophilus oryzae]|uniref:Chymotrypsinogen A-like n=1 Tax=Sitophilus oryzae TaxID=7048 RepID=A0A6J2XJD7_SITOR|nr:chymotrypsinogen A-like [Sitophilus oryzae]
MGTFGCIVWSLVYFLDTTMSQAPPASASRSFHCVNDVSLCKDVVIDPRAGEANTPSTQLKVLTPQTDCPAGFFKCNSVVCGVPSVQPSPANGYVTANSAPWQAYIASDTYGYIGGGVLVNQYNVVTAAHKVSNITNKPPVSIKVSLGMYTTASTQNVQVVQVSQIWQNSGYNAQYLKNDVAILRLATPINFSANIRPICLPTAGKSYVTDSTTNCLVTGWGQTNFNVIDAPTRTLKQAYVPIVSNDKCTASYTQVLGAAYTAAYLDFPGELCAGGQAQIDACTMADLHWFVETVPVLR